MPNQYLNWTDEEKHRLIVMKQSGAAWADIGLEFNRTPEACRFAYRRLEGDVSVTYRLKESPYPKYDQPLVAEGDALILGDLEAPFHHAEFVNRCLDLSQRWGIEQVILNGDFLHFDSISAWEPSWANPTKAGLNEAQERTLVNFLQSLPSKHQERGFDLLESIGGDNAGGPNLSAEMAAARQVVTAINHCFKRIDCVIGNHEGRLLRAMQTPIFPADILRLIDAETWRIAPYYFMYLDTADGRWICEHPRGASKATAANLASKFLCHVVMGHSHILDFGWDKSGRYYAVTAGCCVDETRLPYAAQRHNTNWAHQLGAVIVRDGVPWLLHQRVDWKRLAGL